MKTCRRSRAITGRLAIRVCGFRERNIRAWDRHGEDCSMIDFHDFHSNHYLRMNQRRLEHLASLGLPLSGRTVLGSWAMASVTCRRSF
jgi:hypothetical protein